VSGVERSTSQYLSGWAESKPICPINFLSNLCKFFAKYNTIPHTAQPDKVCHLLLIMIFCIWRVRALCEYLNFTPILCNQSLFFGPWPAFNLLFKSNCLLRTDKIASIHQFNRSSQKSITIRICTLLMLGKPSVQITCYTCIIAMIRTFQNINIIISVRISHKSSIYRASTPLSLTDLSLWCLFEVSSVNTKILINKISSNHNFCQAERSRSSSAQLTSSQIFPNKLQLLSVWAKPIWTNSMQVN